MLYLSITTRPERLISEYFKKVYNSIIERTYNRSKIIQKRRYYGLMLFVSLPFPFTGVWTGSLASNLLGLSKQKSIFAVLVGVIISSTAVTSMVYFGFLTLNMLK